MTTFQGFGPTVRSWFEGLEADNSREYFAAHRDVFEESVRDQMEALLTELGEKFGGEVKLFRQNRDIRFSPDKSPYKTNTYGVVYGSELAPQGCCGARAWRSATRCRWAGASAAPRAFSS